MELYMLPNNFFVLHSLVAFISMGLSSQSLDVRILPQSRANSNGVLLYDMGRLELSAINSALGDKSLLGYRPLVIGFDATPDNLDKLGSELSWQPTETWAIYCM